MRLGEQNRGLFSSWHARVGLALICAGEALIAIRLRPISDFYFPLVWFGLILFLDGAVYAQRGWSPFSSARRTFWIMIPISIVIWWLFEWFNLAVNNWQYIGSSYTGAGFVIFASVSFSTVVLAVWNASSVVRLLLPGSDRAAEKRVPAALRMSVVLAGLMCLLLPIALPRYAFGLIWGCAALILDPINDWRGRPSMLAAVWNRRWREPVSFALGSLLCGVFWEAWNYWSLPKWIYTIPYPNQVHIFEMPLAGYAGYLPFGLEIFAMTNFALMVLRMAPVTLEPTTTSIPEERQQELAS